LQRRSFLTGAATANVAAGALQSFVARLYGQGQAAIPPVVHPVGAGQDRLGEPHRMGFSSLLFKVLPGETGGGLFLIEHTHLTAGGPPLHLHREQEEWFYVMEGQVVFQVGDRRVELHPGESVLAPRRVPHTFSAVSAEPARMLIGFCPAGKMDQYFRDVSAPGFAQAHPTAMQDPEFFRRYEIELVGPSPFWK